jgi:hypothetical protein
MWHRQNSCDGIASDDADEGKITLTIVPLKLLQQNHVHILVLMMCN